MHSDVNQAWETLLSRGQVSLQGEPAVWSKATNWLIVVLMVLLGLLALGILASFVFLVVSSVGIFPGTIFGFLGCAAMLAVMGMLVVRWRRARKNYQELETLPVVIEEKGLTLRGMGPIPWHDFGPAEHHMVRAEHDDGYTRRAIMPLTASGYHNVNQLLAPDLRERISPATGPFWNRHHPNIYVPGVEGMKPDEMMWLINSAREKFINS